MDAIVTAGGIPKPGEPLYEYTQGKNKALLDIAGKPMIQWVLDALTASNNVDNIVIVGLPEDSRLDCSKIKSYLPNHGGLLQNLRAGVVETLAINPQAQYVATVSSDIPTITSETVNWIIRTAMETEQDVYYSVVTREVMEARFPHSNRSYIHLRDMEVCGGDMNVIRTMTVTSNDELWERIIDARKNVWKQASLIGYDTLALLLLRLISLDRGVRMVTKRVGLSGRVLVSPYAEIAMDVDKPHQYEQVRDDLLHSSSQLANDGGTSQN